MRARIERALLLVTAVACVWVATGCERRSAADPWIVPGPTVPSPFSTRDPFVWDSPDELRMWTDNAVSRGPIGIDTDNSNGAIAIAFVENVSDLVLRGPNLDPPLKRVRAVRIRYQWTPSGSRKIGTLTALFDAVNSPRIDLQLRFGADLREGPGWQEAEIRVPSYAGSYTPLDVNYIYFLGDSANAGLLRIDAISLIPEGV